MEKDKRDILEDEFEEENDSGMDECSDEEEYIDIEELMKILGAEEEKSINTQEELLPPFVMKMDNLKDCEVDKEEFVVGVKEASKMLGYFTTLKNGGLSSELIFKIISTEMQMDYNLKIAEIQKEITLEMAKIQKNNTDNKIL